MWMQKNINKRLIKRAIWSQYVYEIEAEEKVDKMTNELLTKNAEALKMGTIKTAEASERGIVEIETLQFTNKSLIDTLDEVLRIQTEGRAKRQAAESELVRLEGELKDKLLEVRNTLPSEE